MQMVKRVAGPAVPLMLDDIDTDRIIPARFLRCVTFDGIGEHAFEDDKQQDPSHPFNDARYRNAKVLVAGRNFGCGSSREHAPQSLMRWGLQAIVAESYAEIFFGNCISLGVPPVTAARSDLEALAAAVAQDPTLEVTVELEANEVRAGKLTFPCSMPDSARDALLSGRWDFLGELLHHTPDVQQKMHELPYFRQFSPA